MGTWNGEQMWLVHGRRDKDGFIKWIQSGDYTAHLKKIVVEKVFPLSSGHSEGRGRSPHVKMGFGSAWHIVLFPKRKLKLSCYHKAQFRAMHSAEPRSKNLKTPLQIFSRKIPGNKKNLLIKNLKNVI